MKKIKSKIITFALAFCLIIPCMFMLTACKDDHTHTLTKVDAVAATCTDDGNTAYYTCDCGKYFSDEEGKTEIEEDSWVVEATGHSYSNTWSKNETHHWKQATCSHSTEKGFYAEHEVVEGACICGYVPTTYTVEEADWNEVFVGDYLMNGKVVITNETFSEGATEPISTETMTMISNDTHMAMIMGESLEDKMYMAKQGETWYGVVYVEALGGWYGMPQTEQEVASYTFAGSQGIVFVDKFDSFEYDEENHCYVAQDFVLDEEYDVVADSVKIYIEDGKLVGMEVTIGVEGNTQVSTYVFSDYGTAVVDNFPTWTPAPTE